jgi:hypothetical protein
MVVGAEEDKEEEDWEKEEAKRTHLARVERALLAASAAPPSRLLCK